MAKQLNVNLSMTANTSAAVAQLKQLQQQLTNLMNSTTNVNNNSFGITKEIQEATQAVAQLKVQLTAATNIDTGKLDLSKFTQQMTNSNMNISKYHIALSALGADGEKAFASLAESISNADARLSNANDKLVQFATTLKNTARWQISSSVLHGFMGAMSSAYNYAQDLNKSLNEIRIVTGQSEEQMAKFAAQANKAAQSLSSTTTAYTNAALIFYQQGLNDEAVKERTDTVIKLSNVTGDSAEDVSSYMTAIWENFANGSKSLEYYADVITRLGADTAASSAEIAEGIESFASIGQTIGLSYEYATSALTTIVAKTRASASEVGNGLRTIFSRLQNLSLGETLDDGTNLTKYSKALETVGVSIKDASGELKSMDSILDGLAGKWDTLDQAEKVALANTVGGVRQYTKLISLMDNWDFMKQNIQSAKNSEGSLQEQADIYAESWKAAQKRVKASAQAIYNALLDDKFFIGLNNTFSKFLDIINEVIKGLGGLKGVLLTIGTIITQVYQKDISNSMENMATSLITRTKAGQKKIEQIRKDVNDELINNAYNDGTLSGAATASAYKAQGEAQQTLINNAKNMSEEQRNIAQLLLDQNKSLRDAAIKQAEVAKAAQDEAIAQKSIFELRNGLRNSGAVKDATQKATRAGRLSTIYTGLASSADNINFNDVDSAKSKTAIKELQSYITSLKKGYAELGTTAQEVLGKDAGNALNRMASAFDKDGNLIKNKIDELRLGWQQWGDIFMQGDANYERALENLAGQMSGISANSIRLGTATEEEVQKFNQAKEAARQMTQQFVEVGTTETKMAAQSGTVVTNLDRIKKKMQEMSQGSISMSQALTQISSTLMSVGMAISSVVGLINIWKDDEADLSTKLLTTLTTLGMIVPTIMSVVKGLGTAKQAITVFGVTTSAAMWQVTLIVAALTALVAVIALVSDAIYKASPEGVFKSAAAAAEDAKTAAESVKEAYDDLQNSLNSLDDGLEKIESLARGTLEWREAIIKSNQSLINLLSAYGMLNNSNFTVDQDGIMRLADGVEEQLTEAALNALQQANIAEYGTKIFANNASSRNNASKAAADISVMRPSPSGNTSYDAVGENTNLSADIGMAIAQAMNSGALVDLTNKDAINKALISVNNLTETEKLSVAQQIASNQELQNSMSELAIIVAENTAANDVLSQQIVNSEYGNKIDNAGMTDAETTAVKQITGDALEQVTNDLYEKIWKDKGPFGGGKTDAEVQKAYAEAMGWATDTIEDKSGNKAKYYTKNGTEIGVISDEVARKYLAQQEAIKQLNGNIQDYISNVEKMVEQGNQIAEGVGNELLSFAGGSGGNFDELTKSGLEAIKNNIDATTDNNGKLTEDTFKIGDIEVNEDYATTLGYKSVQAYYDAIQAALSSGENAFDYEAIAKSWGIESVTGKIFNTVGDHFNSLFDNNTLDLSEMTSGAMKDFSSAYKSIFDQGGEEALSYVDQILTTSGDKAEEVAALIGKVDWSNWDSVQNLGTELNELGIEIDNNFIDQLAQATKATKDFSAKNFCEQLKNIISIIDGIATGDTISAENYATLGDGYENYFMLMADGTYKLIGQAEDFHKAVMSNTIADLQTKTEELNTSKDVLQDQLEAATNALRGKQLNDLSTSQNIYNAEKDSNTYNGNNVQAQLDFLEQMNYNIDQINAWRNDLADDHTTVDVLNDIGAAVADAATEYNGLQDQIAATDFALEEAYEATASTAKNFKELDQMLQDNLISMDAYMKAFEAMNNAERMEDLDADKVADYADYLQELAENEEDAYLGAEKLSDDIIDDNKAAQDLAIQVKRMNKGIEDLADNWDDWSDILKNSSKGSEEYSDTLSEVKNAMSDLLDISSDFISADFIDSLVNDADAMKLMQKAAQGDGEAIDALRQKALENIILNLKLNDSELTNEELWNKVQSLQSMLDEMGPITAGTKIDLSGVENGEAEFINKLNQLISEAGMSADQVNAMLSGMGFTANFASQPQKVTVKEPDQTITHHKIENRKTEVINGAEIETYDETTTTETIPGKTHEGSVDAYSLETTEPGTTVVPQINSLTRQASGSANNYSSSNTGGKPAGGGSGGGGGSSQSQEYNDEDYKEYTDEEDRYHVIKNQIEDLTAQYKKISTAKDKAFGPNRIKLLDQEIAKQKELTAANKKYLEEVEQYQELDKGKMVSYGAIFDKNGTITNYDKLLEEQVRFYNEAVDKFNEAYTDDEGAKAAFEAAKERYEQFKEDLDKYEESQDLYKDQLQAVIDAENQERALRLEKTQAEVELKVNVSEDSIEYLDYALNNIENKAYDVANAFALLDKKTATYFEKSKAYVDGLKSLFANQGLTDDDFNKLLAGDVSAFEKIKSMLSNGENAGFTSDDIDAIRDYVKELISTNEELQEVRQTVHDQLLTVWDEWNDKMDTAISKIEHLQNITSSYKNIIDIVGQKSLGLTDSFMSGLSQKTIDQANNKLQAEKARYDSLKKSRDEAFAKYENQKNSGILSEEEVKMWEDNLKQMDDDVQSAAENFQSAWEDALNAANEEFENSVQRIIDAYSDAAAGLMGSMSELQEAFDRGTDLSDQYLDDYEKIYQFSKLNRDIQESIDSTDSVKAKKELLALQSKINAYEESGVEISEYQMDYLRKEYELKKAQIDLEESQNAKSQVKMQRDNEGNYSYVYTANDDDVAKAEQNYEDKLHEMQVANADYIKELQGNMVQMEQDYQDKVQEIMTDTSLTAEERMVKLNEVNEYYDEKMKYYISEAQVWQDNSSRLYDQDWKNYSEMTGYKISAADQWIDKWKETQLAMLTGFSSLEEYQQNHDTNVANLLLSAGSAFSTWQTNIETAMNSAGTSIGTFGDDATETLKAISEASKETKDSVVDMAESAEEAINGVTEAITNWEDAYSKVLKETLAGNEQLINSFNELLRAWSGVSSLPDTTPESKKVSTQSTQAPKTSSFDTGGYTGSWGADGKFALLHEKELILNAEDTKNFLTAIDTVRQISDMIDLNALSSSGGLTSLFAAKASTSDRTLQQEVTIHAEFPNVEDKDQISAAFNDLVNLASQYANRK